jgi:hypothetical protein
MFGKSIKKNLFWLCPASMITGGISTVWADLNNHGVQASPMIRSENGK